MMSWRPFDRPWGGLIHSCLLVSLLAGASGCPDKSQPAEGDAATFVPAPPTPPALPSAEPVDAGAGTDAGEPPTTAAGDTGAADSGEQQPPDVTEMGESIVYRATGRARRGVDIDLVRQAAAERARRNLGKLLKNKGIIHKDERRLAGAVIERYWRRGRWIYARAALTVPKNNPAVNAPAQDASNSTGAGTKTSPAPAANGGKQ